MVDWLLDRNRTTQLEFHYLAEFLRKYAETKPEYYASLTISLLHRLCKQRGRQTVDDLCRLCEWGTDTDHTGTVLRNLEKALRTLARKAPLPAASSQINFYRCVSAKSSR